MELVRHWILRNGRSSLVPFQKVADTGLPLRRIRKRLVFAYEVFDEGVIVRDMANTALLAE